MLNADVEIRYELLELVIKLGGFCPGVVLMPVTLAWRTFRSWLAHTYVVCVRTSLQSEQVLYTRMLSKLDPCEKLSFTA